MGDDEPTQWPPTLEIDMTDRSRAIMNCYELMERLVDEYGGRGSISRAGENRVQVRLEYDIPPSEDGDS